MSKKMSLRALALVTTCLIPLIAVSAAEDQPENQVTIGVRTQSADSALFGRYNGFPDKGVAGIGSLSIENKDAWNSGTARYLLIEADDLDITGNRLLPSASAAIRYGVQGDWGLKLFYDGIPYQQSLTFHSLMNSSGGSQGIAPYSLIPAYNTNNSATPAGGAPAGVPTKLNNSGLTVTALIFNSTTGAITGGGATPAQLAAAQSVLAANYALLNSYNGSQSVGTFREKMGGAADWSPLTDWTFSVNVTHEHKQGAKENSFTTNGTTNINYFPEPVDYDSNSYTVAARYSTKQLQGVFSYSFSQFTDNLASFNSFNPFMPATSATTLYGKGYTGVVYSLPPSNSAHQVKGLVAYNLTPVTRINLNAGYSLMQQSSVNPLQYGGASADPYIPNNYQAMVQHFFGNAVLTTRPFDHADFRASYTIDDRKNDSTPVVIPAAFYGMVTADTVGTTVNGGTNHVPVTSVPVSMLNQTMKLDAGYVLMPGTKINLSYSYADKQRDYSVTDRNRENTAGIRLHSSLDDTLDASVGLTHSVRTADSYSANSAWAALNYPATNIPGTGLYYLAARTRDELKANLNWGIDNSLTAGFTAKFYNDHYPNSLYGVTNDYKVAAGPDISYTPSKDLALQLYYTYEEIYTGQNFSSSNSNIAARTDWTLHDKDSVHSLGVNADWTPADKWKLRIGDTLSYGATAFDEGYMLITSSTGVPQTQAPTNLGSALPDQHTILNSAFLRGEYKVSDTLSLLGGYSYERAVAKDYLYMQAAGSPANGPNISSLPGDGNPSYAIHVLTMAVKVRW